MEGDDKRIIKLSKQNRITSCVSECESVCWSNSNQLLTSDQRDDIESMRRVLLTLTHPYACVRRSFVRSVVLIPVSFVCIRICCLLFLLFDHCSLFLLCTVQCSVHAAQRSAATTNQKKPTKQTNKEKDNTHNKEKKEKRNRDSILLRRNFRRFATITEKLIASIKLVWRA